MENSRQGQRSASPMPNRPSPRPDEPLMLSPQNALRVLRRRTGGKISRPTFYRWLTSGTLTSIRVGYHIYVPWFALEEFIERCLKGERL